MPDSAATRPRLIGINHVALEVGDIDEALGAGASRKTESARTELREKGIEPPANA